MAIRKSVSRMFYLVSVLLAGTGHVLAQGEGTVAESIHPLWWTAPIGAVMALIFAYIFYKSMMKNDEGNEKMREIAQHVREGANAYIKQQYKVVAIFFAIMFVILSFMAFVLHLQSGWVPFAFLTGGAFSGLCGYLGMRTATLASARTAEGARKSLNSGLQVAFRSGAVMGLIVVGFGLLDISLWFLVLYWLVPYLGYPALSLAEITVTMLCFGMGASSQALFARVGGGIFTKAADVGADLVGKVEAGIPEDDPRNPATIADNVGDNVGDVAGMGADLYESYCGSILATAALGVAASFGMRGLMVPMIIAGIAIPFSIIGIFAVRSGERATQGQLLKSLSRGVNLSAILILIASAFVVYYMLQGEVGKLGATGIWGSIVVGLVAGIIIGKGTEYYTSQEYGPTKGIAEHANTGPATVIISGMSVGMMSTWIPVMTVSVAILLSYGFAGGFTTPASGLYGVAIAAVGMLSTLGITLATDAYGPIADNAGGNAEMSGLGPEVRERTDALDSLGNTTAATGKGFAIGSAALTALALIAAYMEEVRFNLQRIVERASGAVGDMVDMGHGLFARIASEGHHEAIIMIRGEEVGVKTATLAQFVDFYQINLMNPKVLVGLFLGSMAAFIFCALTMRAVGRAAGSMVEEVRRQFREKPGIMEGTDTPDYAACVAISTKGAQHEMLVPSVLALIIPIATACVLGVTGVVGLLFGVLVTGFVLAVMMANAGGAWDNAKKYIESGVHGGKGSDAHKAGVVGDTVGDPFKDTSGPSLNILIKLMAMVSVVFAGLAVKFGPIVSAWLRME